MTRKRHSPLAPLPRNDGRSPRLVLAAVVLALAALGVLLKVVVFAPQPVAYDAAGCAEGGVTGHTVVVVDRTDVLTHSKYRAVRELVLRLGRELRVGEKLSLYEIDANNMKGLSLPVFVHCRPRDGADADPLTENPKLLAMRYDKEFETPLAEALSKYESGREQPRSPIIECLMDLVHVPDFGPEVPRRRLVVFSDLLQHTDLYSHYAVRPDFERYAADSRRRQMVPDLGGVRVSLYYMLRQESGALRRQDNAHVRFWLEFFAAAGSRVERVEKVR